jgi:hypothetical protein
MPSIPGTIHSALGEPPAERAATPRRQARRRIQRRDGDAPPHRAGLSRTTSQSWSFWILATCDPRRGDELGGGWVVCYLGATQQPHLCATACCLSGSAQGRRARRGLGCLLFGSGAAATSACYSVLPSVFCFVFISHRHDVSTGNWTEAISRA